MDDRRFDDLGRALGALGTRRGALRTLIGAVLGVGAGGATTDTLANPKGRGKSRGKKKKGCPKAPCPAGYHRDKGTCRCECTRTTCRGGMEFDTGACRCKCPSGMRECKDGCVGKDECCPGDPPCPEDPKGCCHAPGLDVCTIDGCCRELDGFKACNNFCVDTTTNRNHCGACNTACDAGDTCVDGECRAIDRCPDGRAPCPGKPGSDGPFCRPQQHEACCGDTSCNALHDCCDANEGVCCAKGRCTSGRCCPAGREVCGDLCCPFGEQCCGGECCSAFFCVHGQCCPNIPCGRSPGSRVCPGDGEFCCGPTLESDDGWACPRGDVSAGVATCAPGGRCCPAGTNYRDECQACCASLFHTCPFAECVPPTAGRF